MERLGVASPPVYGQGGPPLRSTSSTPIPHWPASRPRLNEPTIGLHPRDNRRLINALAHLRNLGNTVLMVEHDREIIESAD